MKTEISKFCEAYLNILNVLPPVLKNAAEQTEKGEDQALLQRPLRALNDIRARLLRDQGRPADATACLAGSSRQKISENTPFAAPTSNRRCADDAMLRKLAISSTDSPLSRR